MRLAERIGYNEGDISMRFECAQITDVGSRSINEDSIGVFESKGNNCFVVCDGLGGHGMGDVASSLAVEVFKSQFYKSDDVETFLSSAFCAAQDILLTEQKARNARRKMKTTAVSVVTDKKYAYIGHVGDSRAYVFSHNKVKKRTLDHSIPQMLVIAGDIKESEIRHHPERNTVLKVIGVEWEEPQYELMRTFPLRKCQAFLLCTDGFWELIEEEEMCALLKDSENVSEWLSRMADIVRKNGKDNNADNFSAIAVWCVR